MDRFETMKAFITVSEEGSFTRAALKLDTSNQLVSKYVSHLEEQLGVRLFNRTTRSVHLTEAGEQCAQHVRHILESIQDMEGGLGELKKKAQGVLRINAPVSFSAKHLGALIGEFRQLHPAVSFDLQLNDRKVDVIEEGFDLALRIGYLSSSSLIAKRIAPVRLVLAASPNYLARHGVPSHPNELIPEDYLHYRYMTHSQEQSPLMQALKQSIKKGGAGMSANNGDVLVEAAIAGQGYILQPTFLAGDAIRQGKLQVILPEFEPEPMGLYVVFPHRKLMATKLRLFIDFMSDYFGPVPQWDQF